MRGTKFRYGGTTGATELGYDAMRCALLRYGMVIRRCCCCRRSLSPPSYAPTLSSYKVSSCRVMCLARAQALVQTGTGTNRHWYKQALVQKQRVLYGMRPNQYVHRTHTGTKAVVA
eukprot:3941013-Rhodomonas_salina.1